MPNHKLSHWTDDQLERFLRLRQELFLDPLGSNRKRFEEAAVLLQRALFAWYFSRPGEFPGLLSLVQQSATETRQLRKEELLTIHERRFSLHVPAPEIPAVESSVSENQWQKIFGSFNTSYGAQRLFERFLSELDEYTNPSLRFNHRYLGELLPHDNMVSYFAATAATFLNENAIIGKVSPCVTHMEQAAMIRLAQMVGWEGRLEIAKPENPEDQSALPLQRLPTPYPPAQNADLWEREQPTGGIVGDGTIANISALLIARNATFNYLLGWGEATQSLGPDIAWQIIKDVYDYDRMVVITSKGAHYSVAKASHMAGVGQLDVIDAAGSVNPWILDKEALEKTLEGMEGIKNEPKRKKTCLLLALVLIAGKTETGYIDKIEEVAEVLEKPDHCHPDLETVLAKRKQIETEIRSHIKKSLAGADQAHYKEMILMDSYLSSQNNPRYSKTEIDRRLRIQVEGARYNRPFIHVDAAHGGAFLTVPSLRNNEFKGIHLVDTVTLDGHKMFYCYYPCGGLLIRTTRWARSLHTGQSRYISEDTSHEAYGEDRWYLGELKEPRDQEEIEREKQAQEKPNEEQVIERFKERRGIAEMPWIYPGLYMGRKAVAGLDAARNHNGRPAMAARSELRHLPFTSSLEGSRGCQGIMQMYFNLSTIGFDGYRSLLEWTYLLTRRCAEAVSLGRVYVRPVTAEELPTKGWMGNGKDWANQDGPLAFVEESDRALEPRRIVPVLGGRLLRLSNGSCNQLLVSYVPQNVAMLMSSQGAKYWSRLPDDKNEDARPGRSRFWQTMHYLWRVNEHLWVKYLYANPAFTYYVGHTEFEPLLPNKGEQDEEPEAKKSLEKLLCDWNVWARWDPQQSERDAWLFRVNDFKDPKALALALAQSRDPLYVYLRDKFSPQSRSVVTAFDGSGPVPESDLVNGLNQLLDDSELFDAKAFNRVDLTEHTRILVEQKPKGDANVRLNRLLLEEVFPLHIAKRQNEEKDWVCPFFQVLAEEIKAARDLYSKESAKGNYSEGLVRFFAHKIVIMHPYTDESILSDLLGKVMFWGERSAEAVQAADASCQGWLRGRTDFE